MGLTRRNFIKLAASTVCGGTFLSSCSGIRTKTTAAKQLNIYSWPDYIHPDVIPEFEKRYGIQVVYDTISSNEALLSKLQAGASEYDIIVPSNYAVEKLRELQLIRPIEKDRLSNFKYLMERFQNSVFDPQCRYSIPYTFGTTGIAFNKAAFKAHNAAYPDDWDVFWDKRFAGRMTLLEDPRETIGFALKKHGYSYNTVDHAPIEEACADLQTQKPLMMCYTSDQAIIYLASADSQISLTFSGDARQAARQNADVSYVIPKSGASMWVDSMCILKTAPHVENAHLWLNFMLEPEIAAANTSFTFYGTANSGAISKLKESLREDKTIYPPADILDKCEEISDVGTAIFFYDKKWTELKCV